MDGIGFEVVVNKGTPDGAFGMMLGYGKHQTVKVESVKKGSAAEICGLLKNDLVLAIDGQPIEQILGIAVDSLRKNKNKSVKFTVMPEVGKLKQIECNAVDDVIIQCNKKKLGFEIAVGPKTMALVTKVKPNSPADLAGLQPGDLVVGIRGSETAPHHFELVGEMKNARSELWLRVERRFHWTKRLYGVATSNVEDKENKTTGYMQVPEAKKVINPPSSSCGYMDVPESNQASSSNTSGYMDVPEWGTQAKQTSPVQSTRRVNPDIADVIGEVDDDSDVEL